MGQDLRSGARGQGFDGVGGRRNDVLGQIREAEAGERSGSARLSEPAIKDGGLVGRLVAGEVGDVCASQVRPGIG